MSDEPPIYVTARQLIELLDNADSWVCPEDAGREFYAIWDKHKNRISNALLEQEEQLHASSEISVINTVKLILFPYLHEQITTEAAQRMMREIKPYLRTTKPVSVSLKELAELIGKSTDSYYTNEADTLNAAEDVLELLQKNGLEVKCVD